MDTKLLLDKHRDYSLNERSMRKCADCVAGQDAVKSSPYSLEYLPKLPGHAAASDGARLYDTYQKYAQFYGAAGRTVQALTGAAFGKDPQVTLPPALVDAGLQDDVTLDGEPLDTFARKILRDAIIQGRPLVLVDAPYLSEEESRGLSLADMRERSRPYLSLYETDAVLDWREERRAGRKVTSYVKLYETGAVSAPESLETKYLERVRVLTLTEDGYYRHRAWEREKDVDHGGDKDEGWALTLDTEPTVKGQKLRSIPVFPVSEQGIEWQLSPPPINDLCDIVIAHFRNSASYQNGLLMSGCPTACVAGLLAEDSKDKSGKIVLGASSILQFDEQGKWGFLEIGTQGLGEIRQSMERLEKQMALMGSRMLEVEKRQVESGEAARIHRSGENGILSNLCSSVSQAVTAALREIAVWMGADPGLVSYQINVDFGDGKIDPQSLSQIMLAYQQGVISADTFFYNLKRGDIYPQGWSLEKEQEAITERATDEFSLGDEKYQDILRRLEALGVTVDGD